MHATLRALLLQRHVHLLRLNVHCLRCRAAHVPMRSHRMGCFMRGARPAAPQHHGRAAVPGRWGPAGMLRTAARSSCSCCRRCWPGLVLHDKLAPAPAAAIAAPLLMLVKVLRCHGGARGEGGPWRARVRVASRPLPCTTSCRGAGDCCCLCRPCVCHTGGAGSGPHSSGLAPTAAPQAAEAACTAGGGGRG